MKSRFTFRLILAVCVMCCSLYSNLYAADPTITNVNGEVLQHDDGTQYVKITYTAKDFPATGSLITFSANCIGSNGVPSFKTTPLSSELTGDIGLVIGNGQKTIIWEDEKCLIRLDKQDE